MSRPLKKIPTETPPTPTLALAGVCEIEAEAAAAPDGKAVLPRCRMVAYTGGPMRVAGWR